MYVKSINQHDFEMVIKEHDLHSGSYIVFPIIGRTIRSP
jgi:hypothetical protein